MGEAGWVSMNILYRSREFSFRRQRYRRVSTDQVPSPVWFGGQGHLAWGELNEEVGFELVILHNKDMFIHQELSRSQWKHWLLQIVRHQGVMDL